MKNKNRHEQPHDEVINVLKGLRPAASKLDPSTVFYQAGFQAGRRNGADDRSSLIGSRLFAIIAAAVVTAALTGPASYRIGQVSGRTQAAPGVMEVAQDAATETATIESNADDPDIKPPDETQSPVVADDPPPLLARWIHRWQLSRESLNQHDQPETLSVVHATRWSQNRALQSWPELAFPDDVLDQNEQTLRAMTGESGGAMRQTFAVGDTGLWAQVLEVSR